MKRFGLLSLLFVAILLTGCLAPSIRISISPDPIELQFGDEELEKVQVKLSFSGIGFYQVDRIVVLIEGKDGQSEPTVLTSKEIKKKIPMAFLVATPKSLRT